MISSLFRKFGVLVIIAMAAAMALSTAVLAQGEETVKWRVQSHWPRSSSSFEGSLVKVKNGIEQCTNGRLVLELYPAGALFKGNQIFGAVARGTIEMGTTSPSYLRNETPLAGIAAGLPFAFQNVWEAIYFYKNMGFGEMLREGLAEHGVYHWIDKLYPTEMVVKQPIESWEDFTSLKIRSSGILQEFLTDAGASASYIPGGELYVALSSGVVDGAHWGAAQGAKSMNLYEVAKYHVKPSLGIGADSWVVNQEAMDALPPELRQCVVKTLDEHFWQRTNEYIYLEQVALADAIQNLGVEVNHLPPEVVDKLTAVAVKAWEEEAAQGPKAAKAIDMLKEFLASLGRLPSTQSDSQSDSGSGTTGG